MHTSRHLVTLLIIGILGAVGSGCASGGSGGGAATPSLERTSNRSASSPTDAPHSPVRPTQDGQPSRTTRPTSATEKLLLPEQVQLQEGGDGLGPSCSADGEFPDGFSRDPGVWLNNLYSPTEYPYIVALCLRGFRPEAPIELRLAAGGFTASTRVMPRSGVPEANSDLGYEEEPSTTLFDDGAELSIYAQDYSGGPVGGPPGAFVTEMWTFYPPPAARDAIADSGAIELTAVQDDLTAHIEQAISLPSTRSYYRLNNTGSDSERLVLVGYPEGADVPIGLYRRAAGSQKASLVDELGTVTVPRSRLVSFEIPQDLLSGRPSGTYCLIPPVDQGTGCESVDNWPPYPGQISLGDTGDRVRAWQVILIGAGIISDRPENRDGVYGPATDAAVSRFLRDHDWSYLDGDGVLGRQMYDLFTR
jgi:hypothetical protein